MSKSTVKYFTYSNVITFINDFNEPLEDYIVIIRNYSIMKFNNYSKFNKPIMILPNSLTHLTFKKNFNKNIELPENLLFVGTSEPSIEMIEKMPNNVKELLIKFNSNAFKLENLPNSIEKLNIYYYKYNYPIDWIIKPVSLNHLIINNVEIQLENN